MSEHKCPATVYDPTGWGRGHECGRKAAYEHDGKHYCKTHHPPTVRAKRDAKNDEWTAKWNAEQAAAKAKREALAEQERRAACFPELLEALKKAVETTYSDTLHAEWTSLIAKATGAPPTSVEPPCVKEK